jgi:hypothetical protein
MNGLVVFAVLGISSVAHADDGHGYYDWLMDGVRTITSAMGLGSSNAQSIGGGGGGGSVTVPELNLGGLAAGLTLAVGVLIVIGSRRRRVS